MGTKLSKEELDLKNTEDLLSKNKAAQKKDSEDVKGSWDNFVDKKDPKQSDKKNTTNLAS